MNSCAIRRVLTVAIVAALASAGATAVALAEGRVFQIGGLHGTATTLGDSDDAGDAVYAISSTDPLGTNPKLLPQLFRWDADAGAVEQLTAWARGVRPDFDGPSVSDDGAWVAVVSTSDPVGSNPGGTEELFLVATDGTEVRQLTAIADPVARLDHFMLAGSGNRVVFESNGDPLGSNPSRYAQLFVVAADGTGLAQVTAHSSTLTGGLLWPSISDDGTRIAYESAEGSLFGGQQIVAILHDGTGRRVLTDLMFRSPGRVAISGDGTTIAFETEPLSLTPPQGGCFGGNQIAVVDWDGTGLHLVTGVCLGDAAAGQAFTPSLTDDGATIFYTANEIFVWNVERVPKSGFPKTRLTEVALEPGPLAQCLSARAAGGGGRVAFQCRYGAPFGGSNPDLSEELYVMDGDGLGPMQLSDGVDGASIDPAVASTARTVAYASDANPTGAAGFWFPQVYVAGLDGADIARVTALAGGAVEDVSIADDATKIVFAHDGDPLGTNEYGGFEVFAIESDGTGLRQLTPSRPGTVPSNGPDLADDGSRVVLQSRVDLLETGLLDTLWRVYTVAPDGTALTRLTTDGIATDPNPRIDPTGTWVVYVDDGDVRRDRFDGGLNVALTTHGGVQRADVASGGDLVVYAAAADPLGTNSDLNHELFLRDVPAGTTTQLTATDSGDNLSPAISGDGAWVHFWSDAPHFGESGDGYRTPYRVRLADGLIERTGGPVACGTYEARFFLQPPDPVLDGDLAAFFAPGDCAGANPDLSLEVFVADRTAQAAIRPGKDGPTVVTWDAESGPARYDVIRGSVADLGADGDLGTVQCVEDDSPDTTSDPDPDTPAPGQAFFFLHRGAQGPSETGTYGRSSAGAERLPSAGDCPGV